MIEIQDRKADNGIQQDRKADNGIQQAGDGSGNPLSSLIPATTSYINDVEFTRKTTSTVSATLQK
jgi:hypothetical protein